MPFSSDWKINGAGVLTSPTGKQIDETAIGRIARQIAVSGTGIVAGTNLTLTAGETVGTWAAISSNSQVVPAPGLYRINGYCDTSSNQVAAPACPSLELYKNGVLSQKLGRGARFSSSTGDVFPIPCAPVFVRITTPASEALSLRSDQTLSINLAWLLIERVGP